MSTSSQRRPTPRQISRSWIFGAVALLLIVAVLSFPAGRAAARQLLAVFRVRQIAVIPVSPSEEGVSRLGTALESSFFAEEPTMVVEPVEAQAASPEEAAGQIGYPVRAPAWLPEDVPATGYTIYTSTRGEGAFTTTREGLELLLAVADLDPSQLPADLSEATVTVSFGGMVHQEIGRLSLVQMFDPEVSYPEGLDPVLLSRAALRLMGADPAEADRLATSVDWMTTLVLPVPVDQATYQIVNVAGAQGVYLEPSEPVEVFGRPMERPSSPEEAARQREQAEVTYAKPGVIIWQRDSAVNMISGTLSQDEALQIAESLYE